MTISRQRYRVRARAGADAADAVLVEGISLSRAPPARQARKVERAEGQDLGLRVFIGKRQAIVSRATARRRRWPNWSNARWRWPGSARGRISAASPIPTRSRMTGPQLDMLDPERARRRDPDRARARRRGGGACRPGVTNSEGAEAAGAARAWRWPRQRFCRRLCRVEPRYQRRRCSPAPAPAWSATTTTPARSMPPICATRRDRQKRRRARGQAARRPQDADRPVPGGVRSARRGRLASRICSARSPARRSRAAPAFSRTSSASAFSPRHHHHRRSAPPARAALEAVRRRGRSQPRRAIVENGVLTTWLLDLRSARQLGLKTTGHAARGTASPPSPSATNL